MKLRFLKIFAVFLFTATSLFSQKVDPLVLNLKGEVGDPKVEDAVSLGEFRISLDSQVFSQKNSNPEFSSLRFSREEAINPQLNSNRGWANLGNTSRFSDFNPKTVLEVRKKEAHLFGASLTLTATFLRDELSGLSSPTVFSARKRMGRWAVYGELEKGDSISREFSPPKVVAEPRGSPHILMNVISSDIPGKTHVSETPSVERSEIPNLNNYYLEATYDFHPDVKGRVSYERSRQDVLDENEKVQVEGILKTSKDTLIKAGFRNQTVTPDAPERKPETNTRVWTEFILKF